MNAMANGDDSCTPGLINIMVQIAQGDMGLIIRRHAYVLKDTQ
jgi:hypothetical protein